MPGTPEFGAGARLHRRPKAGETGAVAEKQSSVKATGEMSAATLTEVGRGTVVVGRMAVCCVLCPARH